MAEENKTIQPFTNIPQVPEGEAGAKETYLNNVKEFQVGFGAKVLRTDRRGLWLGGKDPNNAPFFVDMEGNLTATSATLSGFLAVGDAAGDINGNPTEVDGGKLQDGTIVAAKIAAGTITANEIAANTITANEIAANTITGSRIASIDTSDLSSAFVPDDGVLIYSGGILGRKSGSNTFSLDATTGDAAFSGDISASTITGSTLTTANSGRRVVLTTTLAQFYDENGTEIVNTYAGSSSYIIEGQQTNSAILLECGSSSEVVFSVGNTRIAAVTGNGNGGIKPWSSDTYDLGNISLKWNDIWNTGTHVYKGIDQPVVYWGYVNSGASNGVNNHSFSISSGGTGRYTITHNLGTSSYVLVATAFAAAGGGAISAKVSSKGTNSVEVTTFNDAGSAVDNDFMFMLTLGT